MHEISTEMCGLLEQQSKFLNRPRVLSAMSAEDVEVYAHRNNRLNQLFKELERNGLMLKGNSSPKKILAVRCPTCGARPRERCELSSGQPRTEPHRHRELLAADRPND